MNGHNLGRYWPAKGPTKTMYVPGPWLVQGHNEVRFVSPTCNSLSIQTS